MADFYKDGKFQQEAAMEAMKDMFAFYDVPFTELMAKDMWVTDFGLGDFENVGMGGIFWVNNAEPKILCTCYLSVARTNDSGTCPCSYYISC